MVCFKSLGMLLLIPCCFQKCQIRYYNCPTICGPERAFLGCRPIALVEGMGCCRRTSVFGWQEGEVTCTFRMAVAYSKLSPVYMRTRHEMMLESC